MHHASPRLRLRWYLLGLLTLVGGSEVVARLSRDTFEAAAHRARFKAELLARQPPLRFVAIGTSRLNDAVAPAIVSGQLEGSSARGFNASVPSSSMATQAFLAAGALEHPGLEALFLEASPAQAASFDDPSLGPEVAPSGSFEDRLLSASALLRYRRVLMVESLPRLVALAWPSRYDGSEFFRSHWLAESLRGWWRTPPLVLPPPVVICPKADGALAVDPRLEAAVEAWTAEAKAARAKGIEPYFVAPPIRAVARGEECQAEWSKLLASLASRSGAPVLSWACAEAPDAMFPDGNHHLGTMGRDAFSAALGAAWRRLAEGPACEAAR